MKFFPLFYQLQNKHCLIVGAGKVASRRARALWSAGAIIDVISPVISADLCSLVKDNGGECQELFFDQQLITKNYFLIITATDDSEVNIRVSQYAKANNIPINVASDQSLCDFIFPSIVDRDPLTIAISNNGSSPVLTRLLKEQIELLIPTSYSTLARFVGKYRDRIKTIIPHAKNRVLFLESMLRGPIAMAIFSGNTDKAEQILENTLSARDFIKNTKTIPQGEVYLVGAGPGDAELLTLKAFRLLKQADIVLYDRLVSDDVMALIKPDAELLYVGKRRDDHSVPQASINQLLVDHAKLGKRVVRLKGGDPFMFGRGGEEIETLIDENIPFQVVPGITAASGCSAYAGIPLTHRDYAQSVQFVTGQLQNGSIDLCWQELIAPRKTLVFYMSLKNLTFICQSLIEHGMSATMPVALIEKGSTSDQRVLVSNLKKLPEELKRQSIGSPSLFIVGEVVRLSEKLDWFSRR